MRTMDIFLNGWLVSQEQYVPCYLFWLSRMLAIKVLSVLDSRNGHAWGAEISTLLFPPLDYIKLRSILGAHKLMSILEPCTCSRRPLIIPQWERSFFVHLMYLLTVHLQELIGQASKLPLKRNSWRRCNLCNVLHIGQLARTNPCENPQFRNWYCNVVVSSFYFWQ